MPPLAEPPAEEPRIDASPPSALRRSAVRTVLAILTSVLGNAVYLLDLNSAPGQVQFVLVQGFAGGLVVLPVAFAEFHMVERRTRLRVAIPVLWALAAAAIYAAFAQSQYSSSLFLYGRYEAYRSLMWVLESSVSKPLDFVSGFGGLAAPVAAASAARLCGLTLRTQLLVCLASAILISAPLLLLFTKLLDYKFMTFMALVSAFALPLAYRVSDRVDARLAGS